MAEYSAIVISFFSSVVFSWLLTRESAKEDLIIQEQKLALKSYRYLNYMESAAVTAEKIINHYIDDSGNGLDANTKIILGRAMDQVGYIRGGINTCKMDWMDMLSDSGKAKCPDNSGSPIGDYGTIVVDPGLSVNQEDA